MSLSEAGLGDALIAARAIHFAATAIMVGALLFRAVVAEPVSKTAPEAAAVLASQVRRVSRISFVTAVVTGLLWLLVQSISITGLSFWDSLSSDGVGAIVAETQFGEVAAIRLALSVVLAICLAGDRVLLLRSIALAAALAFAAAIAWTGHAGSTAGNLGILHLASDIAHLWAASAWIGGLVMLVLLLKTSQRYRMPAWDKLRLDAVRRFSVLGIVAVATLLLSGAINAWIIAGSWQVLLATAYGKLLLVKIALVVAMVAFAAVNRLRLTPRLVSPGATEHDASPQLARNTGIEIALGLAIFAIVGALGLQHPIIHP